MGDVLDRWQDPVFGELVWRTEGEEWEGRITFGGRAVRLSLDPGILSPTPAEQLAVVEPARRLFGGLPAVEPELRRQAAAEIAEAVGEQDDDAELPLSGFADSLELEAIDLLETGGILRYRSPEFPGMGVSIYFDAELGFDGSEVG